VYLTTVIYSFMVLAIWSYIHYDCKLWW